MQPYRVDNGPRHPVKPYDVDVLAGAAGLRTTAGDMLAWAEANLHPDRLSEGVGAGRTALAAALVDAHEPHAKVGTNGRIGLAWFIDPATGRHYHGGATRGTTAEVSFNPREDTALVVLSNTGPGQRLLGRHPRRSHPRAARRDHAGRAGRHDDSGRGQRAAPRCASPPRGGSR